jgi:hypothetical protein
MSNDSGSISDETCISDEGKKNSAMTTSMMSASMEAR